MEPSGASGTVPLSAQVPLWEVHPSALMSQTLMTSTAGRAIEMMLVWSHLMVFSIGLTLVNAAGGNYSPEAVGMVQRRL